MPRIYSNNFSATLASGISAIDTSFDVTSAAGLPVLGAGDYFHLTIDDGSFIEIVRVDAVVGNTLSVQRGQESTVQRVFASGSAVELRVTAGSFGAQSTPVAADIAYDNTASGLTAIELQAAVDELAAAGGGDAVNTAYDNTTSGLQGTNVQSAVDELALRASGYDEYALYENLTATIPYDDTVPLVTEGTEILSVTVVPSSPDTHLDVRFSGFIVGGTSNAVSTVAIFRDGVCIAAAGSDQPYGELNNTTSIDVRVPSTSATSTTFTVRVGANTGNCKLNGEFTNRRYGGAQKATLTVRES